MVDRYDEQMILGYVEDELTPPQKAQFEHLLVEDERLRNLIAQLLLDRQNLQQMPTEPVPAQVMDGVNQQLERRMLLDITPAGASGRNRATKPAGNIGRWLAYSGMAALLVLSASVFYATLSSANRLKEIDSATQLAATDDQYPQVAMAETKDALVPTTEFGAMQVEMMERVESEDLVNASDAVALATDSGKDAVLEMGEVAGAAMDEAMAEAGSFELDRDTDSAFAVAALEATEADQEDDVNQARGALALYSEDASPVEESAMRAAGKPSPLEKESADGSVAVVAVTTIAAGQEEMAPIVRIDAESDATLMRLDVFAADTRAGEQRLIAWAKSRNIEVRPVARARDRSGRVAGKLRSEGRRAQIDRTPEMVSSDVDSKSIETAGKQQKLTLSLSATLLSALISHLNDRPDQAAILSLPSKHTASGSLAKRPSPQRKNDDADVKSDRVHKTAPSGRLGGTNQLSLTVPTLQTGLPQGTVAPTERPFVSAIRSKGRELDGQMKTRQLDLEAYGPRPITVIVVIHPLESGSSIETKESTR